MEISTEGSKGTDSKTSRTIMASKNKNSLRTINASYPLAKWRADPVWTKLILRPLALPVTWLALKLGLSANQVTYLSIFCVLMGTVFLTLGSRPYAIWGAVLFNLWAILDCVDGNVARMRGTASKYGELIDAFGGYVAYAFVFLAAGMAAENARDSIPEYFNGVNFAMVGALASISNLTMRIMNKQYVMLIGPNMYDLDSDQRRRSRELGLTGVLMPALFAGVFLGLTHWLVIFYSAYHLLALGYIAISLTIKVNTAAKAEIGKDSGIN